MTPADQKPDFLPVGLPRRIGAILYDILILLGIVFAAALPLPLLDGLVGEQSWALFVKRFYLLLVIFIYFGGFWSHGGQTVGMKAWRIQVTSADGSSVTWSRALIRFLSGLLSVASLGMGFLWALTNRERAAWHDRLSSTHLSRLPSTAEPHSEKRETA